MPRPDAPAAAARSFARDALSILGGNVAALVLSFLSGAILARELGPEGRGTLAALLVVPTMLVSLAELGVRQATVVHVGRGRRAPGAVAGTVMTLLVASAALGVVVAGLAYAVWGSPGFTPALVALALVLVPSRLATSYAGGLLLGSQRLGAVGRVRHLPELVRTLVLLALWVGIGVGLAGAMAATLAGAALVAVYSLRLAARDFPLRPRWDPTVAVSLLRLGAVYAVSLFAIQLVFRFDVVLMERLAPPAALGHYALGVALVEQLWQLSTALGTVVFARSARAADPAGFTRSVGRLLRVTVAVTAAGAVALAAAAGWVVPLVYGEAFRPSVQVVYLLMPGVIAFSAFKLVNTDLAGKGRPALSLAAVVPALAVNVGLCVLLIPRYGAAGAAIASA
jgi:O-antigen/teichoic acid export membrane protein